MGIYSTTTPIDRAKQYNNYIGEHISNIKTCFKAYQEKLCAVLNIDKDKLKDLIDKHDVSKYGEPEFVTYLQYFFPKEGESKNKDLFDIGWLYHQNSNPHHPEFWILRDDMGTTILDMPDLFIAEMLLDWAAMGIKFNDTAYVYYQKNGNKKPFSDNTKAKVESCIDIFK